MSDVRRTLALLGVLLAAAGARADALPKVTDVAPSDAPLDVARVVTLATRHSPQLKASLLSLESSRWDVFGSEARYEPVVQLDGTGSQIATPKMLGDSIRINRARRGELGAQLSKHLPWGTDLSLRLSTSVQASRITGGIAALPTSTGSTGTTTGIGNIPLTGFAGFGFGTFGPIYGLNAKLTLKQPLWRGRGRDVYESELQQARAQRTSTAYTRDRTASGVLRDALTAYWELWYADAALAIQQESQALATKQRDEAAARARGGSLAPAEVLTFDTQVATREEELLAARTERARREHELMRVLGLNDQPGAQGTPSEQPAEVRSFLRAEVEQSALAHAAEIREAAAAVELARIRQRTIDNPSKPRLDLDGYVQAQGLGDESVNDAASQFVGGETISALVSLTYEAPMRDRVRRAEAAKGRLATEVAEEQLRQARQQVLADVQGALDRAESGAEKVALAERTAEIAGRQLRAEQARYQTGASTSLSVLEAEDKLRTAQLRLARARADRAEVALVIDHLTGALLKRYAAR